MRTPRVVTTCRPRGIVGDQLLDGGDAMSGDVVDGTFEEGRAVRPVSSGSRSQ